MAASYPTTRVAGKLKQFLSEIGSQPVPSRLNAQGLGARGYKTDAQKSILAVMKFIRFVDASAAPTERYQQFRDPGRSGQVMADALRESYQKLFEAYADPSACTTDQLRSFFAAHTKAPEASQMGMIYVFRALADFADLGVPVNTHTQQAAPRDEEANDQAQLPPSPLASGGLSAPRPPGVGIQISISLTIPETTNAAVYEAFFAAMRKYVLDVGTEQ